LQVCAITEIKDENNDGFPVQKWWFRVLLAHIFCWWCWYSEQQSCALYSECLSGLCFHVYWKSMPCHVEIVSVFNFGLHLATLRQFDKCGGSVSVWDLYVYGEMKW